MTLLDKVQALDPKTRLNAALTVAAILGLVLLYSALGNRIARLEKKRTAREAALTELMLLSQRFKTANADAQRLTNRLAAVKADDTPAKLVDEIGIKGKGVQIKTLKGEERTGAVEDAAEVRIEGLTANETVNLLHRLEKGTRPVVIRKAAFKTRYDDPAKLDLTLTMALLKPSAQERK
jgi:general secretion pathway protein M